MKSHGTDFFISNDVKDVEINCMVNSNICGIYEAHQESGGSVLHRTTCAIVFLQSLKYNANSLTVA